jgi:hypothetical protein
MIEANIKADAQPAANAMRTMVIISCPAPFERLEAVAPTIGDRTTRKPYESERARFWRSCLFIVIPGRRESGEPGIQPRAQLLDSGFARLASAPE